VTWWFASSCLRADSANRGWAISFVILASVVPGDAFFDFFLVMLDHRSRLQEIQSGLEHNSPRRVLSGVRFIFK
jgi:hypothetical protein